MIWKAIFGTKATDEGSTDGPSTTDGQPAPDEGSVTGDRTATSESAQAGDDGGPGSSRRASREAGEGRAQSSTDRVGSAPGTADRCVSGGGDEAVTSSPQSPGIPVTDGSGGRGLAPAAGGENSGTADSTDGTEQDKTGADAQTTSKVAAEAEQGTGPAAASATTSATGGSTVEVSSVSVVVGEHGASAASDVGVVAVGPNGAAAANERGVIAIGPEGGASASEAANATEVAMKEGDGSSGATEESAADESDETETT